MSDTFPPPPKLAYRSVHERLRANAERAPDQTCLISIDQDTRLSWGQLYGLTNRLAALLGEKGIGANDRVAVLTDNSLENLVLYYGVQRHGATYCTVNVEVNAQHLREMLERLEPKLVLWHDALDKEFLGVGAPGEWISFGDCDPDGEAASDGGLFEVLNAYPDAPAAPEVNGPDDICCICFTSGTSATPKGVMHSYSNYDAIAQQTASLWGLTAQDRVLEYRSFSWSSSHQIVLDPLLIGGGQVAFAGKFSHSQFTNWLDTYRPTKAIGVPAVIAMLLDRPLDAAHFAGLEFMSCSTSPLAPEQQRQFEARYGVKLVQHYGMSEGGTVAGNHHLATRLGSVGNPGLAQELRIVGEDGETLPEGGIGEIEIGGPQNAFGYLNPDGSIERVRGKRLRTGDLGYLDADGYLCITGRAKEVIIRGGVNIAPLEIDNALLAHTDIAEAVTIGVPDPIYGEAIVCYVVPRTGAALGEAEIAAHCAATLPEIKRPAQIVVADTVPRNNRGKVDRNAALALWTRAQPDGLT